MIPTAERRYDIDWLRVITIGLLLIYHIAIVFQPWGVFIGFIQSDTPLEWLWIPMTMLNVWRIPLLFVVSGMGVGFAMRKRNLRQLLKERSRRILLPFLFGMIFIVPVHFVIWQQYYRQDISYDPGPGHLWFLANIFIYVVLLSPAFFYLKKNKNGRVAGWIKRLFKHPAGLTLVTAAFVAEALILNPETFEIYAMTWHGFWLGFLAFFFGFCCIISGDPFWTMIQRWKWLFLASAILMYGIRFHQFQLQSPPYLMAVESNLWIFAAFGFARTYLNHSGKTLSYLSQAAYPVYIIHMIFLYLGTWLILPLSLPALLKLILVIGFTFTGCFIFYDRVILRMAFLRPLFGLKKK